jgi:hypothetical protein
MQPMEVQISEQSLTRLREVVAEAVAEGMDRVWSSYVNGEVEISRFSGTAREDLVEIIRRAVREGATPAR